MSNSIRRMVLQVSAVLATAVAVSSVSADIVTIDVSDDGTVDTGTFSPGVDNGLNNVTTSRNFDLRVDSGIFEFDLSAIPTGATILSAEFTGLTSLVVDSTVEVTFHGYVASNPALVEMSDASASGVGLGSLTETSLINNTAFSLNLSDVSTLQSALDTTGVFGIRSQITNQDSWLVASQESGITPPQLKVNFSAVPEPGSLGVLGLAGLCTISSWRRKRSTLLAKGDKSWNATSGVEAWQEPNRNCGWLLAKLEPFFARFDFKIW